MPASHHLFFSEELFVDYGLTVNTGTVPATYVPGTHSLPCLYRYKLITFRLHKYAGKINSFFIDNIIEFFSLKRLK